MRASRYFSQSARDSMRDHDSDSRRLAARIRSEASRPVIRGCGSGSTRASNSRSPSWTASAAMKARVIGIRNLLRPLPD